MKKLRIPILLTLLISCSGDDYQFWDIEKFTMADNALENNEEVKLLYWSGGPDFNKQREYYYHAIVVSEESGDTVNILTAANHGFDESSQNQTYNYVGNEDLAGKILDKFLGGEKDNIRKVARDASFDDLADNDFPTVIGNIGQKTME